MVSWGLCKYENEPEKFFVLLVCNVPHVAHIQMVIFNIIYMFIHSACVFHNNVPHIAHIHNIMCYVL